MPRPIPAAGYAALELVNLTPASYDDPAVPATIPQPDQRPDDYVLTVTREAPT